jgi:hypothetical protein
MSSDEEGLPEFHGPPSSSSSSKETKDEEPDACETCKTGIVSPDGGCRSYRDDLKKKVTTRCYHCYSSNSCACIVCEARCHARDNENALMEHLRSGIKDQLEKLDPMPAELEEEDFKLTAVTTDAEKLKQSSSVRLAYIRALTEVDRDQRYLWLGKNMIDLRRILEAWDLLKSC